jgi:2-iminobutanoate/2-iminopropanoate deaminase
MRVVLATLFALLPAIALAQQVKRSNPDGLSKPTGYTHIVEVTGPVKTIYISGQIALDRDGALVGAGNMKAQADQVFKNLQLALAAAGAKFSDVVKMNTYVTDMEKLPDVREVRGRYFGAATPASTLVQVVHLARPDLMIEVEVIAVVPAR